MKRHKRILVVDDDDAIRELCKEALALKGYSVDAASDGVEAIESLRYSNYDLVITDLDMPRLDGLNLYLQASSEFPHLFDRFMFITGNSTCERAQELMNLKKKCLLKPFRISDFLNAADRFMARPSSRAPAEGGSGKEPARPEVYAGTLNRRKEERLERELRSFVKSEHVSRKEVESITSNISKNGAAIAYSGAPLIPHTNVTIRLVAGEVRLQRHAKVVWSKASDKGLCSGLRFSEPLPTSALMPETSA